MQSNPRARLLVYGRLLQETLFGASETVTGSLSEPARLLVAVLEMVPLSCQLPSAQRWLGRPAAHRPALTALCACCAAVHD